MNLSLSLSWTRTFNRKQLCVWKQWAGKGGISQSDRTQIHFYAPVSHRFGPHNSKALFLFGSVLGAPVHSCSHWNEPMERKSFTWLFHSALPVLTCGAITRKCDPGVSERWPRDPADLLLLTYSVAAIEPQSGDMWSVCEDPNLEKKGEAERGIPTDEDMCAHTHPHTPPQKVREICNSFILMTQELQLREIICMCEWVRVWVCVHVCTCVWDRHRVSVWVSVWVCDWVNLEECLHSWCIKAD